MSYVLGSCSICGGDVTMPNAWYSTKPPVPTCASCGAKAKPSLPVIEMQPGKPAKMPLPEDVSPESAAKLDQTLHGIG